MDRFEIEDTLKTFRVIADTREQITNRAAERFAALGDDLERATLDYGDYCGNITLPDGRPLHDTSVNRIYPACAIERKMSLDELAGCFTRGRDRFQREFERARAAGASVYILIEGGDWEKIQRHAYRSRFHPKAFRASITAWMVRYGAAPIFCKPGTSGELIREILYRDIKERLEKGEYG